MPTVRNVPAENVPYFTPEQVPAAGSAIVPQPNDKPIPSLFQPLKIRGLELHNRILVRRSLLRMIGPNFKYAIWTAGSVMSVLRRQRKTYGMAHGPL